MACDTKQIRGFRIYLIEASRANFCLAGRPRFGLLAMIRNGLTPIGLASFGLLIDQTEGRTTDVRFWTGVAGVVTLTLASLRPDYRRFFTGDENEVTAPPTA